MASKYELITERFMDTLGEVAKPETWPSFLTTACHNFRLSFDKQVLLYLPFTYDASSDIDYMLFESNGNKYCCILNHNGVSKTLERGEWVAPEATVSFSLKLKEGKILEVLDLYNCGYDISDPTMLKTNLPGGDLILFRYG